MSANPTTAISNAGPYSLILRLANLCWSAMLIAFMATGTLSSARIGSITWGPTHDIWSAAIAISQIRFGLSGELAYREVEHAIANEVTSSGDSFRVIDAETRLRDANPMCITRGFQSAAALAKKDLAIPPSKDGYVGDWAEDIGYADFYNLAFRLFGFNAYATHYLYFLLLTVSFVIFGLAFFRDTVAIGTLTLSLTAFFLLSASSFFNYVIPSFAANRFLSTLAMIPLLHVVMTMLRRGALVRVIPVSLAFQSLIMSFAIAARGSAAWCLLAVGATAATIVFLRWRRRRAEVTSSSKLRRREWLTKASSHPVVITVTIVGVVFMVYSSIRNTWIDDRYFQDDNYPHHLVWHSAYLGLAFNPDWKAERPQYSDVPADGDSAGFALFQHAMRKQGIPSVSTNKELYHQYYLRARPYEAFIRNQYLTFLSEHPLYGLELFFYYKPLALYKILVYEAAGTATASWLLAVCSLALASLCFACGATTINSLELIVCFSILWLSSLAPVIWAYPELYTVSDEYWSSAFLALMLIGWLGALLPLGRFKSVFSPRGADSGNCRRGREIRRPWISLPRSK